MNLKLFLVSSTNILLNNYFYQFLILLFFLKGDFITISEITFLIAPLLFLKESFSSNQRNLLLSDKKKTLFQIYFKQRVFYIFLIIILYLLFLNFFFEKVEKNFFIFLVAILITTLWLNELILTNHENNADKKKLISNSIFLFTIYILFILFVIFTNIFLLYLLAALLLYLISKIIFYQKIKTFSFLLSFRNKFSLNYKLLSTLSVNLVNLIWRIFFFLFLDKEFSGIIFSIFAFMSFPSTLYNNTIGMSLEIFKSRKININAIFAIYYIFILCLIFYIYKQKIIPLNNFELSSFALMCGIFSFFGSLIMMFSISKRIKIINYKKTIRNTLFKIDIIYASLNLLSLFCVYFFFGSSFFYILFFSSSIISLSYVFYYKKITE